MFCLYILKSKVRNYNYIGVTNNLERRLKEHNTGTNKTTKPYKPFLLAHQENYKTLQEARKREWFLKCTPQGGKTKRKILNTAGVAASKDAWPFDSPYPLQDKIFISSLTLLKNLLKIYFSPPKIIIK